MSLRIGIDLGGTKIEIAALDVDGGVLVRRRIDTPAGDYSATVEAIVALARSVEREQREVRIANDANCFALSEALDGAGRGAQVVFGAILGTGVGGGLVVHGRLLTGANAICGEWGHNALSSPAAEDHPLPLCYCGRRGCIETFL